MSDGIESNASVGVATTGNGAQRAGALLKQARESAGMHIAALAVSLKVPVKKLEALEAGQLDALSGPVFVRALASSVCRNLKLDPTEILALLPHAVSAPLAQPQELNTPFRASGESAGLSLASRLMAAPVLAVLALLLGALALLFWPHLAPLTLTETDAPAPAGAPTGAEAALSAPVIRSPTSAPAASAAVVQSMPAAVQALPGAVATAAGTTSAVAAPAMAASSVMLTASAPVRPVSAPVARISAGPAVAGEGSIVQFKVSASSWVEVVDAKGETLLRRTVEPGELATAKGALPLRVVVGRADVTEVQVRGRKVDMKSVAQGNVARFEVEP